MFDPIPPSGQELLGHELTHVVQQRAGRVKPDAQQVKGGMNINSDKSLENEADAMGERAAQGKDASMVSGKGSGVQRKEGQGTLSFEEKQQERENQHQEASKNDVILKDIAGDEKISGASLLGTIKIWNQAGHYSGYRTINVISTDDPIKWSQILNKGTSTQHSVLKGFLMAATDEANYVGNKELPHSNHNTLVNVSRSITEKEKMAFMRALFNQSKSKSGTDSLEAVDFSFWLGEYQEDGLLAQFINENYGLAIEGFMEFNESPAEGAKTLVEETTTSSNTHKMTPKPKGSKSRGPGKMVDVIPPVMEAIVSNAYVNSLCSAKKLLINEASSDQVFNMLEEIATNAKMIRGALEGYNASLNSINERNGKIFDFIWDQIPFGGVLKNSITSSALKVVTDELKTKLKNSMKQNPLKKPTKIGDGFDNTMNDAKDIALNNSTIKIDAYKYNEILTTFTSRLY